jgi:hypothetical protein
MIFLPQRTVQVGRPLPFPDPNTIEPKILRWMAEAGSNEQLPRGQRSQVQNEAERRVKVSDGTVGDLIKNRGTGEKPNQKKSSNKNKMIKLG